MKKIADKDCKYLNFELKEQVVSIQVNKQVSCFKIPKVFNNT